MPRVCDHKAYWTPPYKIPWEVFPKGLEDKSLYPQFLQAVIQSGLAEEDDMDEEIDYEIIGVMVALGEMVKQMIESGEIEAWYGMEKV